MVPLPSLSVLMPDRPLSLAPPSADAASAAAKQVQNLIRAAETFQDALNDFQPDSLFALHTLDPVLAPLANVQSTLGFILRIIPGLGGSRDDRREDAPVWPRGSSRDDRREDEPVRPHGRSMSDPTRLAPIRSITHQMAGPASEYPVSPTETSPGLPYSHQHAPSPASSGPPDGGWRRSFPPMSSAPEDHRPKHPTSHPPSSRSLPPLTATNAYFSSFAPVALSNPSRSHSLPDQTKLPFTLPTPPTIVVEQPAAPHPPYPWGAPNKFPLDDYYTWTNGIWHCNHSSCIAANALTSSTLASASSASHSSASSEGDNATSPSDDVAPHSSSSTGPTTRRRLFGMYRASRACPSSILKRAREHVVKHLEEDRAAGAVDGSGWRKGANAAAGVGAGAGLAMMAEMLLQAAAVSGKTAEGELRGVGGAGAEEGGRSRGGREEGVGKVEREREWDEERSISFKRQRQDSGEWGGRSHSGEVHQRTSVVEAR